MTLLTASQICLSRHGRALLHDFSLSLAPGRLHVLLGSNGAGKSSLLRVLSGEWSANSGQVHLRGRPLSELSPQKQAQQRAVLPQQDTLSFGFTVAELVALGRLAAPEQSPASTLQIVHAALQAAQVAHLAERRYTELSGGERRRAQLARVLAQVWDQPNAVLLLDEPTHSLDLAHQHGVMALLSNLAAKGFAVLASLHELNLAAAYADDVTLLREGRLLASGDTSAVLHPTALKAVYGDQLRFLPIQQGHKTLWLSHPETV